MALGFFAAFLHLVWSVLLALGWAKPLVDFKTALHGVKISYTLVDFSLAKAVALIVIAFVVAYIIGQIFANIWNKVQK